MNSTNKTGGYFALCITSIVWGTTWVTSKIAVSEMPTFQMAAIRQGLAACCFLSFFIFYKKLPLPTAKQFLVLFIMSLLMFVGANGLSTWSLKYIPTGLSSLISALYPLSVVLIEMIVFKNKRVSALTFAGLILGMIGVGIVFYENAFHNITPSFLFGSILSFGAMLSWSVGTLILARNKITVDPYFSTGWQMLISSVIFFVIAISSHHTIPVQEISLKAWAAISYLVVAGSIISFIAFIFSMKKLPPPLFSLYAYFNPLVAILIAGLFLEEKLNVHIFYGAIVTLVGVFLVNYSVKKEKEKATGQELV